MKLIFIYTGLIFAVAQLSPAVCSDQSCPPATLDTTSEMDYVMKHIRKAVLNFKVDTSHANLHVDDTQINSYSSIVATGPSCSSLLVEDHDHHHPSHHPQPNHYHHHPQYHPTTITRTSFSTELRNVSVSARLTFGTFFQAFRGTYDSRFASIRVSGAINANLGRQTLELDSLHIDSKRSDFENFHFKGVPDFVMTTILELIKDDIDILYDKLIKAVMKKALKSFHNEAHFRTLARRFNVRIK